MTSAPPLPSDEPLLDLRGLHCPMPVLRTRKALSRMAAGDRVVVLCTDPLAMIDIPHFLRENRHILEAWNESEGISRFTIRKGPDTQ